MLFRRRAESPPIPRRVGFALAAAAGVGLLGALPRADGSLDPLAMLAWVTLIAPAAGFACGAAGVRPLAGLIVPAVWMFVLVQVDLASPRDVVEPIWPALAWTGLFAGGLGLGWLRPGKPPERSWACAGALLLGSLFFTGLGIQGGLAAGDATWGRDHHADAAPARRLSAGRGLRLRRLGLDARAAHRVPPVRRRVVPPRAP